MKRFLQLAVVVVLLCSYAGCGGGDVASAVTATHPVGGEPGAAASNQASAPTSGGEVKSASTSTPTPVVLPVRPESPPNDVVLAFLNAMRDGNSGVAAELLSDQARAETAKHQWPIQPPGAPSATYQLAPAAYADASQSIAHVACLWSEPDGSGGQVQFEVTWALRKLDQGWRVAGFATEVVSGKPPYFFNFEDIANLKETQALAEAAMAEAAEAAADPVGEVAGRPADGTSSR